MGDCGGKVWDGTGWDGMGVNLPTAEKIVVVLKGVSGPPRPQRSTLNVTQSTRVKVGRIILPRSMLRAPNARFCTRMLQMILAVANVILKLGNLSVARILFTLPAYVDGPEAT